jgi:hypothetical protein
MTEYANLLELNDDNMNIKIKLLLNPNIRSDTYKRLNNNLNWKLGSILAITIGILAVYFEIYYLFRIVIILTIQSGLHKNIFDIITSINNDNNNENMATGKLFRTLISYWSNIFIIQIFMWLMTSNTLLILVEINDNQDMNDTQKTVLNAIFWTVTVYNSLIFGGLLSYIP